ncbi:AAA domain-containing protein [Cronbergia sp. UHCC 0137]|uniref:AAA domain-containing protein n=1 Tax=Cronbergia sp. UHCC 0137 TaxID=3110239 RepID=UPI002B213243|nr:AAA domain-containing protein [Cronbergia sp. UHCC 0137]MEA5617609.1 AAA domain-containing protein [Cronbergia sp. UHCC 0137]
MPTFPKNDDSDNWGYTLVGSTIDNLIRNLEGQTAVESYRERRERADELMFECVGQKPCLFYIRRQGAGKDQGEEIWDLIIATDVDDFQLPKRLKELKKTLGFRAAIQQNGNGGLKIISAYLLQPIRGQADGYALPFRLRLLPNHHHHLGIPAKALAQIAKMPVCGNHIPTEDQLQAWKAFLKVEERIAKARQFCVRFLNHNYSSNSRQVTFKIDLNSATLDGSDENYLEVDNFWERVKQAKNQDVKFTETVPTERNRRTSRQLGTIDKVDPKNQTINIRLERDIVEYIAAGNYQLPNNGFLFFDAAGDIKQIERKEKALEQLKQGRTQNPYLGNFLFDASQARSIKKTIKLKSKDLLLSSANPGQKASVEMVLAAEDLVLIQGPPGTGKTTVIAEICYQVALRGGRTLITSQANLAVDNALSRLVHNPVIRAVRKGRAEKVGEEGQPFLEDQVIDRWLKNTATDCETNLTQRRENIQNLQKILALLPRFTDYIQAEEKFNQQQHKLKLEKSNLEASCENQEIAYNEILAKKTEIESLLVGLNDLLDTPENINWESAEVKEFLPLLQPYSEENEEIEIFAEKVRQAIKYTDELGFIRPARGVFGLAVWLGEIEISEFKTGLSYIHDVAVSMVEVGELVGIFQRNSANLQKLETDYQKSIQQHNIQPTIQSWENRKREIDYIIEAMIEWKSTASTNLYQVLKDCQQSNLPLTENMVNLPLGLLMFASTLKMSIVPSGYKVNLPDWELLKKAIAYETEGCFTDKRGKQHNFSYFLQQNFSHIPIVLSKSDAYGAVPVRSQWQSTHQQFQNYQLLNPKQRKLLVENTQVFLIRLQKTYGKLWEWNNIDSTLTKITEELLDTILANARQCIFKVKTETEEQLQILQEQLKHLPENSITQAEISTAKLEVETTKQNANIKLAQVINILVEIQPKLNIPIQLRTLAAEYLTTQSKIWEQPQEFLQQVQFWESRINELEILISSLKPFTVLEIIKNSLNQHSLTIKEETTTFTQQIKKIKTKLRKLREKLESQLSPELIIERNWFETVHDIVKLENTESELFNLDYLRKIQNQFEVWKQQLENEETYLEKYQNFVQDWIKKLRQPSERDSHDLRRIYLDNANVVGITCVQAANYNFSEEFQSFDVVIIDEVSKCTPPELLIPALKGKKLVMVGDHRQLPPMLDTSTVEEVAQSIGNTRQEMQFLEESLFKSQFETADKSIKQMLNTQYRMHPNIMGAINQFYDGKLECGLLEPDSKRAHNLAGEIIKPEHHLIWVKMPGENEFKEERQGTSFLNIPEVDVIERLCQQFETVWSGRVANGEPKKEIAVITFYGAQLRKLDERLQSELFPSLQIRTGTVDRFQGMERPVVIVSMVRNNHQGDVGFAKKPERVNVAFSRAQELLVIVGCHSLFTQQRGQIGSMYSNVSNIVHLHGGFIDVSRFGC